MTSRTRILRTATAAFAMLLLGLSGAAASSQSAQAAVYTPISGTGSTWSQNALDQWRKNVAANYGMTINYNGEGSSAGRRAFIARTVDFAVSEIPFQTRPEDLSAPEVPPVGYAYMPIVAGGTSLMYNLKIGGQLVTNLQLSGDVVTKIFTGVITNWNDPSIKADNPTLLLPDKAIVPVVRSDGSGSTAQFTLWMSKQHSDLWKAFCDCGMTSQFPTSNLPNSKAQSGSLGVSGYVKQDYAEGAITYVEYSYPLKAGFPVAKVKNASGAYVEPIASAVAIALQQAQINEDPASPDYLTQILDAVYNNADSRSYPLSSYSYLIVPTAVDGIFTTEKGATLGAFTRYLLCEGQKQAESLGYSPLPLNLVTAGFDQIKRIPGAAGATECAAGTGGASALPAGGDPGTTPADSPAPAAADGAAAGGAAAVYDENGALVSGGSGIGGAVAKPFALASTGWQAENSVMLFAVVLLLAVVMLPPFLSRRLKRSLRKTPPSV
ncbi:phosphate ABC transporter substrate-binding protein PstS [Leifsonia sp. YAF41]|uniref:phosphate ABC transporter substrate-binding protein PstS n=1 Tax=Leifsonia sp. YAF41 TaxID=3233086 RepID=UPI003F9B975A